MLQCQGNNRLFLQEISISIAKKTAASLLKRPLNGRHLHRFRTTSILFSFEFQSSLQELISVFPLFEAFFSHPLCKSYFRFVPEGAHQRIKYCIVGILLKNHRAVISLLALKHSVDGALTFGSVDEIPTFFYTNETYKAITIVLKQ